MIAFDGSITHTVAVTEVIWFLLGFVGLVVSWRNLVDCWRDSVALNFSGQNGLLRLAAQGNTREEALRVAKCATICAVGLLAMAYPAASPGRPISPLAIVVTIGLFQISALVVVGSMTARRTRIAMREHT